MDKTKPTLNRNGRGLEAVLLIDRAHLFDDAPQQTKELFLALLARGFF